MGRAFGRTNPLWEADKNPRSHLWTPRVHTLCAHCGKDIATTEYRISKGMGKYCSKACQISARMGVPSGRKNQIFVICQECGKEFPTQPARIARGRGKFCSQSCNSTYHAKHSDHFVRKGKKRPDVSGDKHPAWKGGVTQEHQMIRTSLEYKIWRKAVLTRDFHVCQSCGSSKQLHAHHILRFMDFPHKRFDIANGITVCLSCHWKLHNKNERRKKL